MAAAKGPAAGVGGTHTTSNPIEPRRGISPHRQLPSDLFSSARGGPCYGGQSHAETQTPGGYLYFFSRCRRIDGGGVDSSLVTCYML
jgi:hypothetical protein